MRIRLGTLVVSRAGRDNGCRYIVVGKDPNGVLLVADGDRRTFKKPKRKNAKHVWVTDLIDDRTQSPLEGGRSVSDEDIRAALKRLEESGEEVD